MAAPLRAFKFEPERNQSGDDSEGSTWVPPVDNLAGTEAGVGHGGWRLCGTCILFPTDRELQGLRITLIS